MGIVRRAIALAVVIAAASCAIGTGASMAAPGVLRVPEPFQRYFARPSYVPAEVIVRYREGTSGTERADARATVASASSSSLGVPRMELVRLRSGESVTEAIRTLRGDPNVLYAEPNYVRKAFATLPNDPDFADQWGFDNTGQTFAGIGLDDGPANLTGTADADIDAPEAWDTTTGDPSVKVAIVDTGVLYDHPDLAANIWSNPGETGAGKETNEVDDDGNGYVDDWHGWDFYGNSKGVDDNDPADELYHGTHVAGTIGAVGDNGVGQSGVAWQVSLVPLKFLDAEGYGTVADAIKAYEYARDNGIQVVNGSYGGYERSQAEYDAIRRSPQVLFVFAAGNDGSDNDGGSTGMPWSYPAYPASFSRTLPNVISVAASTHRDGRAHYSNYGRRSVDVAAPGYSVRSTFVGSPRFEDGFFEDIQSRWTPAGAGDRWTWDNQWMQVNTNPVTVAWRCMDVDDGEVCVGTPHGSYANNADTTLMYDQAIDLSGKTGCRLNTMLFHDLEKDRDFLAIEASTDGVTWSALGDPLTGSRGRIMRRSLSDFDNDASVYLRFHLTSDAQRVKLGASVFWMWLDRCTPQDFDYEWASGTSMATPHVAGAAALLLAEHPGADPPWVRAAINDGADPIRTWTDRVKSDGRLNVRGALDAAATMTDPIDFALAGPSGGARTGDRTPLLRWHASGADTGIDRYEVFIDGALARTTAPDVLQATAPARLSYGVHTWRVEAVDADGDRTASASRLVGVKAVPHLALRQRTDAGAYRACGESVDDACRWGAGKHPRYEAQTGLGAVMDGATATLSFQQRDDDGRWVTRLHDTTTVHDGIATLRDDRAVVRWGVWRVRASVWNRPLSYGDDSPWSYLVVRS